MSNRWVILGQRHAIHPHPVCSDMLAGNDASSSWHAYHMVVVSALVIDAFGRERIDAGRSRNPPTITAEGIKPHLIRSDEQYVSFIFGHRLRHRYPPKASFLCLV